MYWKQRGVLSISALKLSFSFFFFLFSFLLETTRRKTTLSSHRYITLFVLSRHRCLRRIALIVINVYVYIIYMYTPTNVRFSIDHYYFMPSLDDRYHTYKNIFSTHILLQTLKKTLHSYRRVHTLCRTRSIVSYNLCSLVIIATLYDLWQKCFRTIRTRPNFSFVFVLVY